MDMKKNYITPVTEAYQLETKYCLLNASTETFHTEQAGSGSSGERVNFGRGGIFDDED